MARHAPPEVVRAAYKALSQKFHPDRNPETRAEATRIMAAINASYEILSDPGKREAHDRWIEEKEREANQADSADAAPPPVIAPAARPIGSLGYSILVATVLFIMGFAVWIEGAKKPTPPPVKARSSETPAEIGYSRAAMAPNGQPWPTSAGYLDGCPRLRTNGRSSVTIDNTSNDADVHVKLVSLDDPKNLIAREFFIPAYSKFTLHRVEAGLYDVRYRDLSSGATWRSEEFDLQETTTETGVQFSNLTMTLYKVADGNMQTYVLPESAF